MEASVFNWGYRFFDALSAAWFYATFCNIKHIVKTRLHFIRFSIFSAKQVFCCVHVETCAFTCLCFSHVCVAKFVAITWCNILTSTLVLLIMSLLLSVSQLLPACVFAVTMVPET